MPRGPPAADPFPDRRFMPDLCGRLADAGDRPLVERLRLMFRHDMSGFGGVVPNPDRTVRGDRLHAAFGGAGREAGARPADSEAVRAVARAHRASAAQIRPVWTLRQGPHVPAIAGTGDPDHLVANVAAGAIRLSDDDMALLRPRGQDGS